MGPKCADGPDGALGPQTVHIRGTKTAYRGRGFPLTTPLRAVITELGDRGERLVTRPDGRPFDPIRFRNGPWCKAFHKTGLPYRRPYAMRHTFAIWSLLAGVHPERLVKLMGHGSKQMVYEVYGRYAEGIEHDARRVRDYLGLAEKNRPRGTVGGTPTVFEASTMI